MENRIYMIGSSYQDDPCVILSTTMLGCSETRKEYAWNYDILYTFIGYLPCNIVSLNAQTIIIQIFHLLALSFALYSPQLDIPKFYALPPIAMAIVGLN